MKSIKVSEATGAALDWLVATCEGHQWRCPWMLEREGLRSWQSYEQGWGNPTPPYSTDWSQGGPLIERERISICGGPTFAPDWYACYGDVVEESAGESGPTPLVAAMRAYAASKLGETVEVPEELVS